MTYRELYTQGKGTLAAVGITEADLDARLLLEYVCGTNRNDLLVHGDREVGAEQQERYEALLQQRAKRIPLQHLTGVQEFMGLEFQVNEHVLIPRQDTEILVEEVLKHLHDGMRLLDMCTGSGCILISLLHYSNECEGVGADISAEALEVARRNAGKLLGVGWSETSEQVSLVVDADAQCPEASSELPEAIKFVESDLFENISGKFDIIVSNPPYICSDVIATLEPEVRDHEPRQALDGTADGLLFYRKIVEESRNYLVGGGKLFFEIGYDQGVSVSALMEQAGFVDVEVLKDYAGLDRVVYGTLSFEKLDML